MSEQISWLEHVVLAVGVLLLTGGLSASIKLFGGVTDGLWFFLQTVTTTGYGPGVWKEGQKELAIVLMIVCIPLWGTTISILVSRLNQKFLVDSGQASRGERGRQ